MYQQSKDVWPRSEVCQHMRTKTKQHREVLQSTEKQTINNNLFENYVLRPVLM
jgi:hypothetical protein